MAQTIEKPTEPITEDEPRRARDPLALFDTLQDEMFRLWGHASPFLPRAFARPSTQMTDFPATWAPRVDMFQKNGDIVVKAELPGVEKNDIKLSVREDELVIEGQRHSESEVKEKDFYRMERAFGSFYRRIPLPANVKTEEIKAQFAEGVLEVRIPKVAEPEPKPQTIPIA